MLAAEMATWPSPLQQVRWLWGLDARPEVQIRVPVPPGERPHLDLGRRGLPEMVTVRGQPPGPAPAKDVYGGAPWWRIGWRPPDRR